MGPTLAGILFDAVGFPLATSFIISSELVVILAIAALVISADCTRFVRRMPLYCFVACTQT